MTGWTGTYRKDVPVDVIARPHRVEYRLRDEAVPGAGRLLGFAESAVGLWWVSVRPGAAATPVGSLPGAHLMLAAHWTGPKVRLLHE
jgi:hypothetical protein